MDKLLAKITDFWDRRGLFKKGDIKKQLKKVREELKEVKLSFFFFRMNPTEENRIELLKEIGDVATALSNFAVMCDTNLETCVKLSHIKNEKRKGKFKDGEWIHE